MIFINDRLVFVSWGGGADIVEVNMTDGSLNVLVSTNLSNIDGVAMDGAGNFYVVSWGADAAHRFEPTFTASPELVISSLDRPADIYYNLKTDTLAVPNAGNNTVIFEFFGEAPPSATGNKLMDFQLELFPNPISEQLTVTSKIAGLLKGAEFKIFTEGGVLISTKMPESGAEQIVFNLNHLPSGSYILQVENNGEVGAKLFLKQ